MHSPARNNNIVPFLNNALLAVDLEADFPL
jgi:hypothetical protein